MLHFEGNAVVRSLFLGAAMTAQAYVDWLQREAPHCSTAQRVTRGGASPT